MRELIGATTNDASHYSPFSIASPGFSVKKNTRVLRRLRVAPVILCEQVNRQDPARRLRYENILLQRKSTFFRDQLSKAGPCSAQLRPACKRTGGQPTELRMIEPKGSNVSSMCEAQVNDD